MSGEEEERRLRRREREREREGKPFSFRASITCEKTVSSLSSPWRKGEKEEEVPKRGTLASLLPPSAVFSPTPNQYPLLSKRGDGFAGVGGGGAREQEEREKKEDPSPTEGKGRRRRGLPEFFFFLDRGSERSASGCATTTIVHPQHPPHLAEARTEHRPSPTEEPHPYPT